jgi:hypothetical protein
MQSSVPGERPRTTAPTRAPCPAGTRHCPFRWAAAPTRTRAAGARRARPACRFSLSRRPSRSLHSTSLHAEDMAPHDLRERSLNRASCHAAGRRQSPCLMRCLSTTATGCAPAAWPGRGARHDRHMTGASGREKKTKSGEVGRVPGAEYQAIGGGERGSNQRRDDVVHARIPHWRGEQVAGRASSASIMRWPPALAAQS